VDDTRRSMNSERDARKGLKMGSLEVSG